MEWSSKTKNSRQKEKKPTEGDDFAKARDAAVRYLGYRARTRAEVWKKLTDAGFTEDVAVQVIDMLAGYNYINDRQYARDYVENGLNNRRLGRARLERELKARGVEAALIDKAFADYEAQAETAPEDRELAAALEHLEKKTRGNRELDEKEKNRCFGYLLRRGFTFEAARRAVKAYIDGDC